MLCKELGHCSVLCLELSNNSRWNISDRTDLDGTGAKYLARSAALRPAPATIIVCGAPFFLEADHNLVGLLENLSKNAGRFSRFRGLSQIVVSRTAAASTLS
jgi:hypothetical protein